MSFLLYYHTALKLKYIERKRPRYTLHFHGRSVFNDDVRTHTQDLSDRLAILRGTRAFPAFFSIGVQGRARVVTTVPRSRLHTDDHGPVSSGPCLRAQNATRQRQSRSISRPGPGPALMDATHAFTTSRSRSRGCVLHQIRPGSEHRTYNVAGSPGVN